MHFWLHNEYAQWTADPDEVKRKPKVKPPPLPLIPPVAHRPPSVAATYLQEFADLAELYGVTDQPETARERASKRWLSTDQFDAFIDAM